MSLKKYQAKRDLKASQEPSATVRQSKTLHFVVQKHAARHLHYDFRLEHRGVLLSWAVPKGPSSDPKDKRLAVQVEDHPLEYQYFEGTIPKGQYGAGTVEIWDRGSYTTPGASSRKEVEKKIAEGLRKGHFAIFLEGEKISGEYIFQKLPDAKNWLLLKRGDPKPVKKNKIPTFISPMLATTVDKPFSDEDWLFEVKWDGYRALAYIEEGKVALKSRQNRSLQFPSIVDQLKKLGGEAILDGELVVLDSEGRSDFQKMQNARQEDLHYMVFDLLFQDGEDLRGLPLLERKERLQKYLPSLSRIHYSDHLVKEGELLYREAAQKNLEGIMGKKMSSPYESRRSRNWVKIKTGRRQEVVIGGFTEPRGSRQKFGALLVGLYNEQNEFVYAGHVGGGFSEQLLNQIYQKLKPLIQSKCPFKNVPKSPMKATWVKPTLSCEVAFTEWTSDGRMRHPVFQGLKEERSTDQLELTHRDKIFWPKEKITKGELIDYYQAIAKYILPYLKNRPIVLYRFPDGITGESFYQKNLESHPSWIQTVPVKHEGKVAQYLLIDNLESLLYAINLGSIDLHPYLSRVGNLDSPDFCILDLDPHGVPFERVIEVAKGAHTLLEELKLRHFCKTSGGNGMHIVIPLHGLYSYEQSRQFALLIGHLLHKQFPKFTSLERSPQKRPKKLYLDCLQNSSGQTIVAPYSVRPRPGAKVSTPLLWEELVEGLDPLQFTLKTVPERLKKIGDIFKPVLEKGVNIEKALKELSKML